MPGLLIIAYLTWLEARRRRIVLAALIGGVAYVAIFATAIYFTVTNTGAENFGAIERNLVAQVMSLAGLYVVNFLTVAVAILLPVDTLSGEISSGVMQTLATKPVRRSDILLGKWLAYAAMTGAYLVVIAAGVTGSIWLVIGHVQPGLGTALPLMLLGALVMLTITITGGVRLTTISNGIVAFVLFGIAFIGGWIEQIGAAAGSDAARQIGTAISLISPADSMWRRAAYDLQPPFMRELAFASPFTGGSTPSTTMIVWTIGYVLVLLAVAVAMFRRRAL